MPWPLLPWPITVSREEQAFPERPVRELYKQGIIRHQDWSPVVGKIMTHNGSVPFGQTVTLDGNGAVRLADPNNHGSDIVGFVTSVNEDSSIANVQLINGSSVMYKMEADNPYAMYSKEVQIKQHMEDEYYSNLEKEL